MQEVNVSGRLITSPEPRPDAEIEVLALHFLSILLRGSVGNSAAYMVEHAFLLASEFRRRAELEKKRRIDGA